MTVAISGWLAQRKKRRFFKLIFHHKPGENGLKKNAKSVAYLLVKKPGREAHLGSVVIAFAATFLSGHFGGPQLLYALLMD
ncbi:MAG: hypothetical protein H7228_02285 [Polaromonas sp.]|nr:hypothetical protein [Polaromonas sp.]